MELLAVDRQEEDTKAEVIDFLTTVMRGRTPIYDSVDLDPDDMYYDFISGTMIAKIRVPKMSDRIKACEHLIKIHGMIIERTESTVNLAKDDYFTFLDSVGRDNNDDT